MVICCDHTMLLISETEHCRHTELKTSGHFSSVSFLNRQRDAVHPLSLVHLPSKDGVWERRRSVDVSAQVRQFPGGCGERGADRSIVPAAPLPPPPG